MSTDSTPHDLAALCRDQAHLLGPALGRAWDRQVSCTPSAEQGGLPEALLELDKPGLVAAWVVDELAGVLLVPEGQVLPAGFRTPTAEQHARLHAAAAAFAKVLLPGGAEPERTHLSVLDDLTQVASHCGEGVQMTRVTIASGDQSSPAWIFWPLPVEHLPEAELEAAGSKPALRESSAAREPVGDFEMGLAQLPNYTRSLLKIEVPVVVTLATKRDALQTILQLGLGTILQFDKGCDETLDLEVAGHRIAEGEPVKVGDKFGLRITAVALPAERFEPIGKKPAA
jgi:flagellar motor switch/type III secretory pathway protein FliN